MRTVIFASLFAVGALAIACGSGGSGTIGSSGGGGGAAGNVSNVCTSLCDWKTKCGKGQPTCAQECSNDAAKYQGKWSASYTGAVSSCFSTLACDRKDDDCIANFGAADPAYPDIAAVTACLDKRQECTVPAAGPDGGTIEGSTFSDDYCQSIAALTDAARAEADRCRGLACSEVRDCLKAAGAFNF